MIFIIKKNLSPGAERASLVGEGLTSHTSHDSQHVVGNSVDSDVNLTNGRLKGQVQESIVDTREVARAIGLRALRVEAERVDVNVLLRDTGVHLIGENSTEVLTFAGLEARVSVELEINLNHWVLSVATFIVEESLSLTVAGLLNSPDQLLDRVVEVQLNAGSGLGTSSNLGDGTSSLNLSDQVLVAGLGKASALLTIKENVVDVHGSLQVRIAKGTAETANQRGSVGVTVADPELREGTSVELNLHIMVLQRNKGQSKTGVAAPPELQGDVVDGLVLGIIDQLSNSVALANKLGKVQLKSVGQLFPDLHKLTILSIDALATNGNLNLVDDGVSDRVDPVDSVRAVGTVGFDGGQGEDKVTAADQISIALNAAGKAATKSSLILEGLFHALNSEISVSAIHQLEESNLGSVSQENILDSLGCHLNESLRHGLSRGGF